MSLVRLVAGAPDGFDRVLQHCRFDGFGGQAYGRDEIRRAFALAGFGYDDGVEVSAAGGAAWFGGERAVVAETVDGFIVRLWALGTITAGSGMPPSVSVPVDCDLDQRPDRVELDARDFPTLGDGEGWLRDLLLRIRTGALDDRLPFERHRAVPLLAFGEGDATAALLRVQGLHGGGLAGFHLAACRMREGEVIVIDRAGVDAAKRRHWQPSLRP